ncbi:MAG: hypothetical protein GY803_13025 [Chloroflexi bacterium]|nr:hypothetical protein [Chloroflexota bacterium]
MDAKTKNRLWWGKALLIDIVLFFASLLVSFLIMAQQEAWAQWAWILSCWVGIITFAALPVIFMNYLSGNESPETNRLLQRSFWGVVGGITTFGIFWITTQSSCCYKSDTSILACFGPMMGLIGVFIGVYSQFYFPLLALALAMPLIATHLQPLVGNRLATIILYIIAFGLVSTGLYLRITRGPPRKPNIPSRKIVWQHARCPQCNNSWTLGQAGTIDAKRCPTCGWSREDESINPFDIPSFLVEEELNDSE